MKVPATKPYFSEDDIEFIIEHFKDILHGNSFLTMWKYGEEFEKKFAEFIGTKYAVSCNSGTSALELIFRSLGVAGKEVILPSNTFIATANAILNAGGIPVFADCDDKMCLDTADVVKRITPKTAAITQVHIGGIISRSTVELRGICKEKGIHFVEDAAQAHGSSLSGTRAGAFGVAAGFSFFSTKVMTTGEGGMVTTNDIAMVEKMMSLREFGKVKTGIYTNYHTTMGYNWRLPEIASLMGIRQLASVPEFMRRRQEIAKLYDEELKDVPGIKIIHPEKDSIHNYFKYIIVLLNHDRATVHKMLEEHEIQPSGYVYEVPLHKQPVFPEAHNISLPNTEFLSTHHICLPIFYSMTDEQVHYVASTFKKILNEFPSKS